jgi:hypothetical protein
VPAHARVREGTPACMRWHRPSTHTRMHEGEQWWCDLQGKVLAAWAPLKLALALPPGAAAQTEMRMHARVSDLLAALQGTVQCLADLPWGGRCPIRWNAPFKG